MKKNILNRISLVLLALLLILPGLIIPSQTASAESLDSNKVLNSEPQPIIYLYARWVDSIVKCTKAIDSSGNPALKETLTESEFTSLNIFRSGDSNTGRVTVGHDLEYSGGLSGDDGVASCEELVPHAKQPVSEVFGGISNFVSQFYDKDGSLYRRKSETERKKSSEDLLARSFISANNKGDIRKARLAVAFSECFKESNNGSNDTDLPDKFLYVSGKNSGSNIKTGLGGDSEELRCSTLANLAKSSNEDLISFMKDNNVTTSVLRNNPQNVYANLRANYMTDTLVSGARASVLQVLNRNLDKVAFCLDASGLPKTINIASIAQWLVTNNYKDNLLTGTIGDGSATEQQAADLKACLLDKQALGDELTPILASLNSGLEIINSDLTSSTGSATETTDSDVCLSKGDNFISWLACPLINLIDSFFSTIKGTFQDMLKFSIEDSGDGTASNLSELKSAWNIFRGIASILIIIFFLTALLVKSIKGE